MDKYKICSNSDWSWSIQNIDTEIVKFKKIPSRFPWVWIEKLDTWWDLDIAKAIFDILKTKFWPVSWKVWPHIKIWSQLYKENGNPADYTELVDIYKKFWFEVSCWQFEL